MKKVIRKISFASLMLMATIVPAAAAEAWETSLCEMLKQLQGVFKILRTLAFIAAAFMIAGWAWGYIKDGKIDDYDKLKGKGLSLLVGFTLLFCIGMMMSFVTSAAGLKTFSCIKDGWGA